MTIDESKKTILITGCSGRLGTAFISQYYNIYNIIGISRKSRHITYPYYHIQDDICNYRSIINKLPVFDCLINNAVKYNIHDPKYYSDGILEELYTNIAIPYELSCCMYNIWKNITKQFSILNISSIASINFYNTNQTTYAMCKVAMNRMTQDLNRSFMPSVRVNAIAPNSFPSHINTSIVLDTMHYIIEDHTINGQVVILDKK